MKQIVQPVAGGPVQVLDVPRPVPGTTEVLVRTVASVISPGTERAVTALAQANLLAKARARPDLVRQVIRKARADGVAVTGHALRSRLAEDLPLGYSAAGVVLEAGTAVTGIRPGQLVATGGAGKASHAEFQAVPALLCATVPDGVPAEDAAFTTIASISLHGLRLAGVGPGSKVVVLGLGLIGQLAARLAMASGCEVAGIDPAAHPRQVAARYGMLALDEQGEPTTEQVLTWSRGRGADAVLVCAAGRSSDAVMRVPALCRDRATVVIVGDTGLHLNRGPLLREGTVTAVRPLLRPRPLRAFLRGLGSGLCPQGRCGGRRAATSRRYSTCWPAAASPFQTWSPTASTSAHADAAYQLIEQRAEPYLAIRLTYPPQSRCGRHPAEARSGHERVPRNRLGRRRRFLYWHAAARLPRRRLRAVCRHRLGQRTVSPAGRRAARVRESAASRGRSHRRPGCRGARDRDSA